MICGLQKEMKIGRQLDGVIKCQKYRQMERENDKKILRIDDKGLYYKFKIG